MRKKIFGIVLMAAIAVIAGWNIGQSENEVKLIDLALANTEALASGEAGWRQFRVVYQDLWHWNCYSGGDSYCPL